VRELAGAADDADVAGVTKPLTLIVPTLRVGMQPGTLRVPLQNWNAERPLRHSHAERGNDHRLRYGLAVRVDVIQHPVHRQFTQHDGMLNAQQGMALSTVQLPGEIVQHDTG